MTSITENWIAFITSVFVDLCVKKSLEECPGCRDKKNSPLLHRHHQMSLFDKISCHFEHNKVKLMEEMDRLLALYKKKFVDATFEESLIGEGMNFLSKATPSTIYFGQYLDEFNDVNVECVTKRIASKTLARPKKARIN